jgi:hypothetical protein
MFQATAQCRLISARCSGDESEVSQERTMRGGQRPTTACARTTNYICKVLSGGRQRGSAPSELCYTICVAPCISQSSDALHKRTEYIAGGPSKCGPSDVTTAEGFISYKVSSIDVALPVGQGIECATSDGKQRQVQADLPTQHRMNLVSRQNDAVSIKKSHSPHCLCRESARRRL